MFKMRWTWSSKKGEIIMWEDRTYETAEMPNSKAIKFAAEFDKRVGTDREINSVDGFNSYVYCMEMIDEEVDICREIEASLKTRN